MPVPTPVAPYSPQELWYWNGLPLNSSYWNITTFGGSRFGLPTNRGNDYQVPYRSGQSYRQKYLDERTVTLTMWMDGSGSQYGWPSTDSRLAFNNNWQQLRQSFMTRNAGGSVQGQLQRNWYWSLGGAAQLVTSTAMAEIAGSMDLTMNGRTGGAFSVDLLLSDPYFYGNSRSQVCSGTSTITAYGEGVVGEGFPSAVNAFTVKVSAPCTVTNNTAGVNFSVSGGPVFPVTIDCLNYTVVDNAGNNQVSAFSHVGSRLWMCLLNGANQVNVSSGTATFTWSDCFV